MYIISFHHLNSLAKIHYHCFLDKLERKRMKETDEVTCLRSKWRCYNQHPGEVSVPIAPLGIKTYQYKPVINTTQETEASSGRGENFL